MNRVVLTESAWGELGESLFGADRMKWKFVCPVCKDQMTPSDYQEAGAPETAIAFSCVNRWRNPDKCNYAGGGLFRLNPVTVQRTSGGETTMFAFAEES
jgi:hypothetical protein